MDFGNVNWIVLTYCECLWTCGLVWKLWNPAASYWTISAH